MEYIYGAILLGYLLVLLLYFRISWNYRLLYGKQSIMDFVCSHDFPCDIYLSYFNL